MSFMREHFPRRVARKDAMAINERGGDYVVHAARPESVAGKVKTACGRFLAPGVQDMAPETSPTCASCRRGLGYDTPRDPTVRAPASGRPCGHSEGESTKGGVCGPCTEANGGVPVLWMSSAPHSQAEVLAAMRGQPKAEA
jgi:hypothetical protein